ncbi:MAG: acyltransferase [Acidimicrobiia bacterium]
MTGGARTSLRDVVASTPESRDRFVDLVRVGSIVAVVLGHWLMAVVVERGGRVHGENALSAIPALRPLTWVVQIIAVFFVVGGYTNARALAGGRDVGTFFRRRAERVLRPTIVFAAVWLAVAVVLEHSSIDPRVVHDATRLAAQPLWFLAVFAATIAIAPAQYALHRRHPWVVLLLAPVATIALDVVRLAGSSDTPATVNYLTVFAVAQELGFHYADGRFESVRRPAALGVAVAAFALLGVLTVAGPYPVSMVGVPGQKISNMSPPTVCMLVLMVAQCALLLAVREPLRRRLGHPGTWSVVVGVNLVIMTLFLWHLSALVFVAAIASRLGHLPAAGTAGWWAQKPLWLGACALVLAGLVRLFMPVERLRSWLVAGRSAVVARGVGLVVAGLGLVGFATSGFGHAFEAGSVFLGMRFPPAVDFVLLVSGWLVATWPLGTVERGGARNDGG